MTVLIITLMQLNILMFLWAVGSAHSFISKYTISLYRGHYKIELQSYNCTHKGHSLGCIRWVCPDLNPNLNMNIFWPAIVVPTGKLRSKVARGMLGLDWSLHHLPASSCRPGWCHLQSQCRGECRERRGVPSQFQRGATVTEDTGDWGGGGPTGECEWVITILPLGTAVVLWPLSLPHKVGGYNGHHLGDRPRTNFLYKTRAKTWIKYSKKHEKQYFHIPS